MPLHEVKGVWESEEGNTPSTVYINPHYVKAIHPYCENHHKIVLHGHESFIVTSDQVDMRSEEELARELMQAAALQMMPDDGEGN